MENNGGENQSNNEVQEEFEKCIVPQVEQITLQSPNGRTEEIESETSLVEVEGVDQVDGLFSCWKRKKNTEEQDLLSDPYRRSPTPDWVNRNVPGEATAAVNKYDKYYNMDHKHRGLAIILNHNKFAITRNGKLQPYKPRVGTECDATRLEHTLRTLSFEVKRYDDLEIAAIIDIIEGVSKMDHSENDCFLLAWLTHGEEDDFLCAYNGVYKLNNLRIMLNARNCPTLASKPKLFIIQACRGKTLDAGVVMREQSTDTSVFRTGNGCTTDSADSSYKTPSNVDFLTFYSTVPGYVSFLTPEGSPFIQILCDMLDEYAYTENFTSICTMVKREVSLRYESNVKGREDEDYKKMAPETADNLLRLLRFSRK